MRTLKFSLAALVSFLPLVWAGPSPAKDSAGNLELARQLNEAFVEVAGKVSPAVVVINVVQDVSWPSEDEGDGEYDALPPGFWRRFHKEFERRLPDKVPGQGSGIIIRENGYISK